MRTLLRVSAGLLLVVAVLGACSRQAVENPTDQVTLQLKWLHRAQFAGFYVADQKGWYADEGLAVTFVEGGPEIDVIKPVIEGTAQFGIAGADELILARAAGRPVRAVATVYRRNPVVFIALADSGISRPQDFIGKTIRVAGNLAPSLHAMTARVGVSPDQYQKVVLPSDVAAFASGEVPVWGAYLDGLAEAVQQAGYDINLIVPDDYGVHFYGDTIFATEDLIAQKPDLVLRFLRASLRGWVYAVENPREVGELVLLYQPDADPALENRRMVVMLPLVHTGEDQVGWMRADVWQGMHDVLLEQGILAQPLPVDQAYTLQFLQQLYGDEPWD